MAAAAVVALAAAAWWIATRPTPAGPLIRFTFALPEGWTLDLETNASMPLAVAPDGRAASGRSRPLADRFHDGAVTPRPLFHAPLASFVGYHYAVTADGQRFLVNTAVPTPLVVAVVSDWTSALNR